MWAAVSPARRVAPIQRAEVGDPVGMEEVPLQTPKVSPHGPRDIGRPRPHHAGDPDRSAEDMQVTSPGAPGGHVTVREGAPSPRGKSAIANSKSATQEGGFDSYDADFAHLRHMYPLRAPPQPNGRPSAANPSHPAAIGDPPGSGSMRHERLRAGRHAQGRPRAASRGPKRGLPLVVRWGWGRAVPVCAARG